MLRKVCVGVLLNCSVFSLAFANAENNCIDLEKPVFQNLYQKQADGFDMPYCSQKNMSVYKQFSQWRELLEVPAPLIELIYDYSTMVGVKAAFRTFYEVAGIPVNNVSNQTIGVVKEIGFSQFMEAYKHTAFVQFDAIVKNSPSQAMFVEQWKARLNRYVLPETVQ